ncbi:putative Fe-S oxidoreductase [Enhygromyxa salina]|uniref:Putative Fe-S oxidoreductase n=1 Tax=Enhygromyxa salina TaxID=215803 RepID=A0A0C2CZM8_9BACT|nr:radical SAM protein [Enhygromyxa salina]KIG15075.1 putative Fe-S oxidoreductase [Enhygromyxa salina]
MKRGAPPPVPAGRKLYPATPPPTRGAISWNMNTSCNYRCSYCTQRFIDDRGRWAADLPRFMAAFAALPGAWEIKLSGGEPFVHPGFLEAVAGLAKLDFVVSVVTNLSASQAKLADFMQAVGPQLGVLSCSLHLEYVDIDDRPDQRDTLSAFIDRCSFARDHAPAGASVCVTCVATRANLAALPRLRERFAAAGLTFKIQPEKQDREVIAYTPGERQALVQLGGHNLTGSIAPDYAGQPCWAGARYFVVDDRGEAYRCYPARRYRTERLGNLLDGSFTLAPLPAPCRYRYCNCTVPIARGMMPRAAARETTHTTRGPT